ncbi:hypothetical protein CCACVL1_14240 [Corchorus capsularis]|uniref:MBD domain-containing protein n=1 Tax=Corchorus capsularis TaxID=210143 RepID=A0A1R3I7S9_COCAP|nr:hypothetical protein CCACVL1_14240 [Corchorus capsularis]
MADENSSKPIPDRWLFVKKAQKDGSLIASSHWCWKGWGLITDLETLKFYTCPETGQKFYSYEDLIRYVKYAEGAKLSIYSPDFVAGVNPRKPKKKASSSDVDDEEDEPVESSDSDDSMFELPTIASLDLLGVTGSETEKEAASGKEKSKNRASNEACSSSGHKDKKQKM